MKHNLIFIFLLQLCCCSLWSQDDEPVTSLDIQYGYKTLTQRNSFSLSNFHNFNYAQPLQQISIGQTGYGEENEELRYYQYISLFLPQNASLDTLHCKVMGLNYGLAFGRDLFEQRKNVDLLVCFGYNVGYIKTYQNQLLNQYNFFFSPKVVLSPRVCIRKLVLSLRAEYEYDITDPHWKKSFFAGSTKAKMPVVWATGLTTLFSVGYKLN